MENFFFVGVSLSNPTFTQQDFRKKQVWLMQKKWIENYKINLFDLPLIHTLEGIGYTKEKAIKELKKKVKYTKNKIKAWFDDNNCSIDDTIYIDRNDIYTNDFFKETYSLIKSLYETNNEVKKIFQEESSKVLNSLGKNYKKDSTMFNTDKASYYIIEELAFFFSSAKIYNAQSANLIYYQTRNLLEKIKPFIPEHIYSSFNLIIINAKDELITLLQQTQEKQLHE